MSLRSRIFCALALGLVDSVSVPDPAQTAETMARLIASGRQGLPPRSPAAPPPATTRRMSLREWVLPFESSLPQSTIV